MLFNKDTHEYIIEQQGVKKVLRSVTDYISEFVPPFQKHAISQAIAKKEGIDVADVLAKWDKKRDLSLNLGNWVHESIEYYLKYDPTFRNQPVEAFIDNINPEHSYHSEVIVYGQNLAGTIDLIELKNDGNVALHDFKTNADLRKGYGKLLAPFDDYKNNALNKYRLQLTVYKKLLESMKNVTVDALNIWHYQDGKFDIIPVEPIPWQTSMNNLTY